MAAANARLKDEWQFSLRDGQEWHNWLFVEASTNCDHGVPSGDLRHRMKVLLLSAGNSIHTVRWANAYVQRGLEVHLVSQHPPLAGLDPHVYVHRFPHWSGLGYLLNGNRVAALAKKLRPDVVNVHYATGYGTLARAIRGVPVVLNVWGSDVFEFPDTSPVHRWILRRNIRHASTVVSTSHVMARRTKAICPWISEPIVVPFGVDTALFKPLRKEGIATVVGTVKTLAPKYGIDTLIHAFKRTLESDTSGDLQLRIVGDGPDRAVLEALTIACGIAERSAFIGAVPHGQVPKELSKLDVYVALSRTHSESFGVAVIEASACGIPVVVSNVGGLPEVVEEGVTGFVVPPNDPERASHAIKVLLSAPELRRTMGLAGRVRVEREYEWGACVGRMIAVLQRTITPHQ